MKKELIFTSRLLTEEELKKLATFIVIELEAATNYGNQIFDKSVKISEDQKIDDYLVYKNKVAVLLELSEHDYNLVTRLDVGYTPNNYINHFTETYVVSKDFKTIINVTNENYEVIGLTLNEVLELTQI